jgi:hypothetical protein
MPVGSLESNDVFVDADGVSRVHAVFDVEAVSATRDVVSRDVPRVALRLSGPPAGSHHCLTVRNRSLCATDGGLPGVLCPGVPDRNPCFLTGHTAR